MAEERHVGRAAARLHITQPPLSRAIRKLEDQLGVALLERTSQGVSLTPAGTALLDGARAVLDQVNRLEGKVVAAAAQRSLVVGTLADAAEHVGNVLGEQFRWRNPGVDVSIHEADLADPTAGLRADLVYVALTRDPFDNHEIATHRLTSEPVGMVVRDDDPPACRKTLKRG